MKGEWATKKALDRLGWKRGFEYRVVCDAINYVYEDPLIGYVHPDKPRQVARELVYSQDVEVIVQRREVKILRIPGPTTFVRGTVISRITPLGDWKDWRIYYSDMGIVKGRKPS